MKYWHKRGNIISFTELSSIQQYDVLQSNPCMASSHENNTYLVIDNTIDGYYNINDFLTSDSHYHGVMGITNTSALGIIISKYGDEAVIQCFG